MRGGTFCFHAHPSPRLVSLISTSLSLSSFILEAELSGISDVLFAATGECSAACGCDVMRRVAWRWCVEEMRSQRWRRRKVGSWCSLGTRVKQDRFVVYHDRCLEEPDPRTGTRHTCSRFRFVSFGSFKKALLFFFSSLVPPKGQCVTFS